MTPDADNGKVIPNTNIMETTNTWGVPASVERINTAKSALEANSIGVVVAKDGADAKAMVLEIVPKGAEIMVMTSVTLDTLGITQEINESGNYNTVKEKLKKMDHTTQESEMRKMGAGPDWVIGSVHAVTEDGKVVVASNTGSQIPAYAYGAQHLIWVVGSQKIVKDLDKAFKRIYEHALPLESERAKKAYGVPGSAVNKMFILNKEVQPGRITVIIVPEVIGF